MTESDILSNDILTQTRLDSYYLGYAEARILQVLKENNGSISIMHDKDFAERIQRIFGLDLVKFTEAIQNLKYGPKNQRHFHKYLNIINYFVYGNSSKTKGMRFGMRLARKKQIEMPLLVP